jgi:hypothetical protein
MNLPITDRKIVSHSAGDRISAMKPALMVWRRRSLQEVLWSANEHLKKVIHMGRASAQGKFRRARLVHCMARLCLSRLSDKLCLALRQRFGLRLHRNTLLQVIQRRPKAAPKAGFMDSGGRY